MHRYTLAQWQHTHHFTQDDRRSERRPQIVIGLTLTMMVLEISRIIVVPGWLVNVLL
jgi:Co/Zn/Cd efflux system component